MYPIETISWKKVKLGDHVDLLTGFPFKSSLYSDDKDSIKLLRGDNVAQGYLRWEGVKRWTLSDSDDFTKYWLEKDDVILAMDRPWIEAGLKNAWVKEGDLPCLLVQRVTRMRGAKGLLTNFLRYIIVDQSFTDYIKPIVTGINVPHISASQIQDYTFQLPPIKVQSKIVTILSAYDYLIENNTRRIQILEEMAQSLYREWFVEFRFPGHEKVKMVESELGMVPEGWEVKKLGELYRTSSGGTPSRKIAEYYGGTINWAKTKELNDNFLFKTEEKITDIGLQKSSAKIFPENTVIMAMYGATIGKLAILAQPASTNQACCAIIKINDLFQHHYIFSFLLVNREKIFSLGAGAAQQNISQTVIQKMKILKPSNTIMKMFNEFVAPNFEHIKSLQLKNDNLRRTRDLLLPKLISGEVDVSSLDITTGELT